ncbi:uncharacterized protein [Melopsittacus undulatus]|uniref:uncharacterized protein isoform X2 n=1 Tax=Melopsittacus undulatus TaxID=13146 RepID=UPI00146AB8E0|nr:uncharacterized protein LOC117438094 isoform X2 [Melopsittacus undulatus]
MPPPQGWGVCVGLALAALGWALLVASLPHSVWGLGGGRRRPWPRSPSPAAYGATASPTPVGSAPVCPSCPSSHCLGSRALAVVSSLVAVPGLILGGVPGARRSSRTAGGAIVLLAASSRVRVCCRQEGAGPWLRWAELWSWRLPGTPHGAEAPLPQPPAWGTST